MQINCGCLILQDEPRTDVSNNNNNKFIYTLDSEVKLCSIVFTDSNAIQ